MIAARQPAFAIHALLDHDPMTVVGDDEAVQIEIETVLQRGAVHFGDETAGLRQRGAIETDALADRRQLQRRLPRMAAAPAADMEAEVSRKRREAAFERADDAGRDSR
jgi:hypothetical protein